MDDSTRRRWSLAQAHDPQLDEHVKKLLAADKERRNPAMGRKADEQMMALCEHMKAHKASIPDAQWQKTLTTLKAMNLRPYWSYCREHMFDIGLEF